MSASDWNKGDHEMFKRLLCLGLTLGLGLAGLALARCDAGQDDDSHIAALVKKLGSTNYTEREKAKKDLEALGMAALGQLRQAAKTDDLETRTRCEKLIEKLEAKLVAENLLAPKKVHLKLKDVTVAQALEELHKLSGYTIVIDGDSAPLTKRTITLDTGEVTFWEALDQLCDKGKLSQPATLINANGGSMRLLPLPVQGPVPALPPPVNPGQPLPKPGGAPAPPNPAKQPPQAVPPQIQVELPAAGGNAKVVMPVQVAPAQPAPVQVQIQGQVQIQPAPGTRPFYYPAGAIVVRDGTFAKVPTCYSGAIRIRLLPPSQASEIVVQPRQDGEALYVLEASAEPRLQMFAVTGSPSLQLAHDDLQQELTVAMEPMPGANGGPVVPIYTGGRSVRQMALRLKQGAKKAAKLTELKGTITIESLTPVPEALITVGDLENAIGKSVEGKKGGSIHLGSFSKQENGSYKVQVTFQPPQPFYPAGLPGNATSSAVGVGMAAPPLQVAGGQAIGRPNQPTPINVANQARLLPQLVDAKGKALTLEQIPQRSARGLNGVVVQEITMICRAGDGVGEPTQLVLFGHRKMTAEAPFAFQHIPLP
jgi:hypothetical protein